jgi:hypothetical protein
LLRCGHCKEHKTFESFYKGESYKRGYSNWCIECQRESNRKHVAKRRAYTKQYYKEHPEKETERIAKRKSLGLCIRCTQFADGNNIYCIKHYEYMKEYRKRWYHTSKAYVANIRITNKQVVLNHYGAKCACCGETTFDFLQVDHINGGGNKHRKKIGANINRWLIKNGFPKEFQILCANCNWAKRYTGVCPHERSKQIQKTA